MRLLFASLGLLGAALLFWVEPLVGKLLLPKLGGAPAVWSTCLVFFQVALLAAYAYAHVLTSRLTVRRQVLVHALLVGAALATLPATIDPAATPPLTENPLPWLLARLSLDIGLPFLVLASTAPLAQRWFSHASPGRDPYWLSVASNGGSFAGLLAFPFLLEPTLALGAQTTLWNVVFGAYVVLLAAGAFAAMRGGPAAPAPAPGPSDEDESPARGAPVTWARQLRWVALGAVPSAYLVGVTTYVSTDISAVPLMWVAPLALYLLTFMLAFSGSAGGAQLRLYSKVLTFFVPVLLLALITKQREPAWGVAALHFATFFVAARALHGALAEDRPSPKHLTGFWLAVSAGGAVGGLFASLVAPLVFPTVLEYPLAMLAALALAPGEDDGERSRRRLAVAAAFGAVLVAGWYVARGVDELWLKFVVVCAAPAVLAIAYFRRPVLLAIAAGPVLLLTVAGGFEKTVQHVERSFFGVHKVAIESGEWRTLFHGATLHGMQPITEDPEKRREPLLYYTRQGPLGEVFGAVHAASKGARVGVVGLGAGSIASYARPGDRYTFFEIDPVVVRLARDTRYFSYLSEARGALRMVVGDARLTLAAHDEQFEVLLLDAFSSDAVPVHLLTREAIRDVYLPRLEPGGVLVLHLSNRFLALESAAAAVAKDLGLAQRFREFSDDSSPAGAGSAWMVLARRDADLGSLALDERWKVARPHGRVWTDDFSNIFDVLAR